VRSYCILNGEESQEDVVVKMEQKITAVVIEIFN
jgi:hypothetical protein